MPSWISSMDRENAHQIKKHDGTAESWGEMWQGSEEPWGKKTYAPISAPWTTILFSGKANSEFYATVAASSIKCRRKTQLKHITTKQNKITILALKEYWQLILVTAFQTTDSLQPDVHGTLDHKEQRTSVKNDEAFQLLCKQACWRMISVW